MSFGLDPRLQDESVLVWRSERALVLLRDEVRWPWLLVVPQTEVMEFHDLDGAHAKTLIDTVRLVAHMLARQPGVSKINLASFGNVVAQQHWHVIGRSPADPLWPAPVIGQPRQSMGATALGSRAEQLRQALQTGQP